MQRRKFLQATLAAIPMSREAATTQVIPKPVSPGFLVKAGEDRFSEPILFMGVNPNLVKISATDTGGQMSVFEYIGLQKMGPSLHVHLHQDEIFYVVEGEYLFQIGDEKKALKAGDTIFLPRNVPHTWIQLTEKGKLIYILQPAGKMEEFFKKINSIKGRPSEEELTRIHAVHGMKVIGPPLSLE